jgi:hypothetical protein
MVSPLRPVRCSVHQIVWPDTVASEVLSPHGVLCVTRYGRSLRGPHPDPGRDAYCNQARQPRGRSASLRALGGREVVWEEQVQKLIAGNAVIQAKLAPSVGENHSELRLTPELGPIQADGSLGELLRAGTILSAMQKGLDPNAILPPVLQGSVTIQDARFRDAGSGGLIVTPNGLVQISDDQLPDLEKQRSRLPFH